MSPAEMQRWSPGVRVSLVHPLRELKVLARDFVGVSDDVFCAAVRRLVGTRDLEMLPLGSSRTFEVELGVTR